MEFASRMVVYVGFIAFALIFYLNVRDMPVEAKTMPIMAIVAITIIAALLLISELVGRFWRPGTAGASAPAKERATRAAEEAQEAESEGEDVPPAVDPRELEEPEPAIPPRRVFMYALPASVLVAAYIFLLPRLGFLFASMGFMAAMAVLLGARSLVKIAAFAVVFPVAFQFLFEGLLELRLP